MDCLLFRHGIAVDRDLWDGSEATRPLTPKGVDKTRRAIAGITHLGIIPDIIISSPFARARETAELIREAYRFKKEIRICDELLPDSPADKVLMLLKSLPPDLSLICVGHEPHLGKTASNMLAGKTIDGLFLKKAGACFIQYEGYPKSGEGLLAWWMAPSQLRKLGKG